MHITRYNKRRLVTGGAALVLFLYFFCWNSYNTIESDTTIRNVKPETVWEFVADFSKMKTLNPTILDFKVLADRGTFDDWNYSVEYNEKLSHFPYWINKNQGHFSVKRILRDRETIYVVSSNHKTCFFMGMYCLKSLGEFNFIAREKDTFVKEVVKYQCPPLMGMFCRREVEYQRKAIISNLTYQFSKKN